MSFINIRAALIKAYEDGDFNLETAYENIFFKKTSKEPWAAIALVTNQPSVATLGEGGTDLHEGFLQIALNYPTGTGEGGVIAKADEVRDHFKAGRVFSYANQDVKIKSCGRSNGRVTEGFFQIILTIYWYAYTAR